VPVVFELELAVVFPLPQPARIIKPASPTTGHKLRMASPPQKTAQTLMIRAAQRFHDES
jgi:hypothetical protein